MSVEVKRKLFKSYSHAQLEHLRRVKNDAEEREEVLKQLKDGLSEQGFDSFYSWQGYTVHVRNGSSLYEMYDCGRKFWSKLAQTDEVNSELRRHRVPSMDSVRINAIGGMEVFREASAQWQKVDVDGIVQASYIYRNLLVVGDVAKQAGGYIYDQDFVNVDQWLTFHNLNVPQDRTQTENLIGYLEFDPPVDGLGNYWAQLETDDHSLIALSAEHCRSLRDATEQLIGRGQKLLEHLHANTGRVGVAQDTAGEWISRVVNHSYSQDLARKYLEKLQWFGSQPGEEVSQLDLAQLLVTVLLVDIYPQIDSTRTRKAFAEFALYAPANVGRHPSDVCKELEAFIRSKQWASAALTPVAMQLLLTGIAPEYRVKGIPSSLVLGSVDWMNFCHAVSLVETVRKGAARVLTHSQIMAYAALEPLSDAHAQLRNLTMIDPMVEWALINEVVTATQLAQNEKATTELAITAFQAYADNFVPRFGALPDRRLLARQALEDAASQCDFLDDKVLNQHPGLYASPSAASMIDLHMSGDLAGGEWDRAAVFPDRVYSNTPTLHAGITNYKRPTRYDSSVVSIFQEFPRLRRLRPNDEEFHRQLRAYQKNINSSLVATVKHALSNMPHTDLQAFLNEKVTFFTFRDKALEVATDYPAGPLVPWAYQHNFETREGKDAATGRFGLAMSVLSAGELITYELFTLRGELKKNYQLGHSLAEKGVFQAPARVDFNGNPKAKHAPENQEFFPIDFTKYVRGELRDFGLDVGLAIAEKLAELPAANNPVKLEYSAYKTFSHPQLSRLAEFIIDKHPIIKFDELLNAATIPTELELERAKGEKIATYFVDLVVPFKKCIEDITTGETNRVVDGIYGCMMDAIALAGTFVGAGAKALSISAKAISTANKAARVAKLVVASSVSLFNPVDGVPTALYGVGKLVHKGSLRFGKQTLELLAVAKSNLSRVHGGEELRRLFRTADDLAPGHVNWRPDGSTAMAFNVLVARKNLRWFALDRLGNRWGPKLSNFNFIASVRLPRPLKTLPVTYTRLFIQQALPRIQTKLDNAIQLMSRQDFKAERDALIKIMMGTTSAEAANRLLDYLRLIRADFAGVSMSNFFLDPFKDTDSLAEFDLDAYGQWKSGNAGADIPFINICTPNLNRQFVEMDFNHDVVADDLIHEMFHATAHNNDVGYAQDAGLAVGGGQQLNVTPLLNLALGRLPVDETGSLFHPATKAFENADSLAVFTSLLSQQSTDNITFNSNMATLRAALAKSANISISEPVLIRLNSHRTGELTDRPSRPVSFQPVPGSHVS
jgi:hypothetical protein